MESDKEQLPDKLIIAEKEPLIWLVSLVFTNKFYGKNNSHSMHNSAQYTAYFKEISGWVSAHKEAKKLLTTIKNELIYEEGEKESENTNMERVKSLDFFYWVESKGCTIPKDVLEGIKWLMQMDSYRKQIEAEESRKFTQLHIEKLNMLRKKPLWAMDKAILYVSGIYSEEPASVVIEYIKKKPEIERLGLYVTHASMASKLQVLGYVLPLDWKANSDIPSYALIEHSSIEPEKFISFIKTLPLLFPLFEERDDKASDQQSKNNKYKLSTKDTNTLFKLIAGMAIKGYGYDPASTRNPATSEIESDTGVTGIRLDDYPAIKKFFAVVDVLQLYDCEESPAKTHLPAQIDEQGYEPAQRELF